MIILLLLTLAAVLYTVIRAKRERTELTVIPPHKKISQINTLLHNIEVYDGTPKGQKQIGGEGH